MWDKVTLDELRAQSELVRTGRWSIHAEKESGEAISQVLCAFTPLLDEVERLQGIIEQWKNCNAQVLLQCDRLRETQWAREAEKARLLADWQDKEAHLVRLARAIGPVYEETNWQEVVDKVLARLNEVEGLRHECRANDELAAIAEMEHGYHMAAKDNLVEIAAALSRLHAVLDPAVLRYAADELSRFYAPNSNAAISRLREMAGAVEKEVG